MFSFDEELAQQERMREHAAPVYHIGRGGAGNFHGSGEGSEKASRMNRTNSNSSTASSGSDASSNGMRRSIEGAWNKVSRGFSR